ncbi:patatin-like phospholipase family protein [Myxococcus sp. K15C18031901]|uniref:patatin-like phospholipase family protein n=1 Tax=Myxococcus dinghuensis TaxID=2906761 RepID=UPI0020A7D664|nr:patatin-like phospholipase family protein [Myxococcus dinghuensis]MCP3101303.1 patatin-like phospholipase family protein [Myxococcus dinghuensis]
MLLKERFQITRPLEEMELALVRAVLAEPGLLDAREEATLRTALSLARLYKVPHGERDVGVGALLTPFREEVERRLSPVLRGPRVPTRDRLVPHVRDLREHAARARDGVLARLRGRIPPEALDRELRHKELVVVAGGGGGTAFVYLGVMNLLAEHGLQPKLLAGASMGAILGLLRSRMARFDATEMINIVRGLSFRKLFRFISTESRYGLPAALRLFLRAGLGRFFDAGPEGSGMRLKDLPVPTLISVGAIRRGMLPRPLEYYERLLGGSPLALLNPVGVASRIQGAMASIAELFTRPEITVRLHLGADDATSEFDALDAAGFSSALPGVIHYDVLREDPRMHALLDGLMAHHGVSRFIDGGLVDNLPAKAAWKAVAKGRIGTRNTFILALDGFAPRLATPFWLPLQRLAAMTVAPNLPYAHLVKRFSRTLSPLEVVPSVELASKALHFGRKAMAEDMPLVCRMLTPLPHVL